MDSVSYSDPATPALDDVSPRFSSVYGGELVTFTGTGFSDSATTTILIETRTCTVQSQSTTEITCITDDRPYVAGREPSLSIHIEGIGYVATRGLLHRYVDLWSDRRSWGGGFLPTEGFIVSIPAGQSLLVDVDSTPVLSAIIVEGSLIFAPDADPNHERTFDATYILVNGGYLEIGTEEFPYTSKLTITMHGDERTPALPIYGNKVIAIRFGRLEMHGPPRSHVWTDIGTTANAGDTCIYLSDMVDGAQLDWQVGEEFVIASTDFEATHAEKRVISSVNNRDTTPEVCFDDPLAYMHYSAIETYGDQSIEMRAEVGLLSRNVKYRGDPETSVKN